jgi:LmbE family N-acetylglucosaminyl deacetylase
MAQTNTSQTLLAVFAHPDDEAFGTGGSLAVYARSGVKVALVCATRGEVGEISDPSLATPETLGEVRENELRCAAETMGISEVIFLDYRDSGMAGSAENQDPRAFINAPAEQVVNKLVSVLRRVRPQVVVTFEPNGGYGHPDHIAIHQHTVSAFHAAADPYFAPQLGFAWQAQRLFYTALPRSFFTALRESLLGAGVSPEEAKRYEERGWPDEQVNVTVDVSQTVDEKWEAFNCHRTQFGPESLMRRLPEEAIKRLLSQEHYHLAWPSSESSAHLSDLFSGL